MFFHLSLPGFHAAVHQGADPALRGRPVAVAVDSSEQAPLFAVSLEGRSQGVWPGMRAAAARRRCPGLTVVTPEPQLYRRAQRAVAQLCGGYTPCVGGRAGRFDGDLAGTEQLWRSRLRPGLDVRDPLEQAIAIARELVRQAGERLHMHAFCGVGERLGVARLAARLAREPAYARAGVVGISPRHERQLLDPLPISWVSDCPRETLRQLADCGVASIGDARALGAEHLRQLAGDDAETLIAALTGEHEPVVPELADPEPEVAVASHCGAAGAGPERVGVLLAKLARELGFALRGRNLACTTLSFEGRHLDGRGVSVVHHARRQLRHDDELAAAAIELGAKRARRVHWERLSLVATGLCAAEEQLELFAPQKHHRLEGARDLLRHRFGGEMVAHAAAG